MKGAQHGRQHDEGEGHNKGHPANALAPVRTRSPALGEERAQRSSWKRPYRVGKDSPGYNRRSAIRRANLRVRLCQGRGQVHQEGQGLPDASSGCNTAGRGGHYLGRPVYAQGDYNRSHPGRVPGYKGSQEPGEQRGR